MRQYPPNGRDRTCTTLEGFLSQDLLSEDPDFPWCGSIRLDRALYLVRHTHHHVGELWSEIKRRGHDLPDWH